MLGQVLKPPLFAALSSNLNIFLPWKKNCNADYSSSLPYLIDVNWLHISCNVTKKKKLAESSKQDDCYLVLLKVQYRSSHFWIFWKALSLDYRPKGKFLNLRTYTTYWYKTKKNWFRIDILTKIEKLLQKEVSVLETKFCKVISKVISGLGKTSGLYC